MRSVYLSKSLQFFLARILAAFFLVVLLGACGTNSTVPASPAPTQQLQVSSTTKAATKAPASDPLKPNAASLNIQQGNLLIQSSSGFQCPYRTTTGTVTDQLVLASGRTTYSQAEIAQMRAYFQANNSFIPALKADNAFTSSPPSTLRWVLGGSTGIIPGEVSGPGGFDCGVVLRVTNTGSTPLQIPKVGVQLNASPQQNTYQYHLINICSFMLPQQSLGPSLCPPHGGGGGDCSYYSASIQLGLGEQHTAFSAVPAAGGVRASNCGTLTLAPSAQDNLTIDFSLAPNTPKDLKYSVTPVFTVITNQGEQKLARSQLAEALTFANANQFSCSTLQGTTLVPMQSSSSGWCM